MTTTPQTKMTCPLSDTKTCQDPLERYLGCKICENCPRDEIKKLKELIARTEQK